MAVRLSHPLAETPPAPVSLTCPQAAVMKGSPLGRSRHQKAVDDHRAENFSCMHGGHAFVQPYALLEGRSPRWAALFARLIATTYTATFTVITATPSATWISLVRPWGYSAEVT